MIWVRELSAGDGPRVVEAMKGDDHKPLFVTHVVTEGDDIVGAASVCATPMLHCWMDSRRMKGRARDSFTALNMGEMLAAAKGVQTLIVPCREGSPYFEYMARLGYAKLGSTVLWAKVLKHGS